jgi:hypothetical protein
MAASESSLVTELNDSVVLLVLHPAMASVSGTRKSTDHAFLKMNRIAVVWPPGR